MNQTELDLRPYLQGIARRWRWIIGIAALTAITAAVASLVLPVTYTASSSVLLLIRQTGSQIGINQPLVSVETIDTASRRQGLLALAKSDAVEAALPPEVLRNITGGTYKPGQLVQENRIDVRAEGDLLIISAEARTPEQAKALADAWSTTYVEYAKRLYTDDHSRVQLASSALVPLEPSNPKLMLNVVAAGLAGAFFAILAFTLEVATGVTIPARGRAKQQERVVKYPSPS
jgi:uncharacterized protein involved in exopolysaccharide biosynthesis